jgi:tRNA A-37 threonylcarbamoyl transferase component Bud32
MRLLLIHDADEIRTRVIQSFTDGVPEAKLDLWDPARQGAPGRDFPWLQFDAVLLDERPGAGDGIDWLLVLKDARAAGLIPPMVMLASAASVSREAKARGAGAVDFVPKSELNGKRAAQAVSVAVNGAKPRVATAPQARAPSAPQPASQPASQPNSRQAPINVGAIGQAVTQGSVNIPGFRVLRKIGEGGMSKVYLAERETDGRTVVLKMLDPTLNTDPLFRQRFVREYQILTRISNPHVVKIYDQAMTPDYGYIAMEYFPGGDMKARLRPPGFAPGTAIALFAQILRALEAVQAAGVVHRDLKPQNIMFRADDQIALLDFGLARELDSTSTLTQKGVVLATPLYMSPEQCLGLPHDARGDLYSAGVILYEMLTGETPYQGKNPPELAYQHVHAPIAKLPPHLAALQPLINVLLAKKPDERPQSARLILDKIEKR